MKKLISLVLFISSVFCLTEVQAESINFNGVDIGPAVDFFGKQVVTLKQSVTVYNWSFTKTESTSSNIGSAEKYSTSFWDHYASEKGSGNMYGHGLYAAIDPITTISYSGGSPYWLLTEMQLPHGFRMLDLPNLLMMQSTFPPEVVNILTKLNCNTVKNIDDFFSAGGAKLKSNCIELSKKIFQETLKIDGFAYSYSDTNFKDCLVGGASFHIPRAFVITSSNWIKPGLIRYYNSKSTHNMESRIMIQSLFYTLLEGNAQMLQSVTSLIGDYLTLNPEMDYEDSTTKCEGEYCVITVNFCNDNKHCEAINLAPLLRPDGSLIKASSAAKIPIRVNAQSGLLWSDLEGKPKATTVSQWLKANKFACSGALPY